MAGYCSISCKWGSWKKFFCEWSNFFFSSNWGFCKPLFFKFLGLWGQILVNHATKSLFWVTKMADYCSLNCWHESRKCFSWKSFLKYLHPHDLERSFFISYFLIGVSINPIFSIFCLHYRNKLMFNFKLKTLFSVAKIAEQYSLNVDANIWLGVFGFTNHVIEIRVTKYLFNQTLNKDDLVSQTLLIAAH